MEDTTSSIDALLAGVNSALPPPQQPEVTQLQHQVRVAPAPAGADWVAGLARSLVSYAILFGVFLVVSLPIFQDHVMSWVPRAVTVSGSLSVTGAFFKALIGTGAYIIAQGVLMNS